MLLSLRQLIKSLKNKTYHHLCISLWDLIAVVWLSVGLTVLIHWGRGWRTNSDVLKYAQAQWESPGTSLEEGEPSVLWKAWEISLGAFWGSLLLLTPSKTCQFILHGYGWRAPKDHAYIWGGVLPGWGCPRHDSKVLWELYWALVIPTGTRKRYKSKRETPQSFHYSCLIFPGRMYMLLTMAPHSNKTLILTLPISFVKFYIISSVSCVPPKFLHHSTNVYNSGIDINN